MNAFELARWHAVRFVRGRRARPRWVRRPASAGTPRVTVMMPSYYSGATIRRSIKSVLSQTVGDLELIVVDDACPETAVETMGDIDDPRIGIVRHEHNRNTCGARNTALAFARAPLVSQLDADDSWKPEYLESILPCFDDPEVGLAYANSHIIGHPTNVDYYIGDPSVHPMDQFPKFAEQCPVPALTATFRTDAARAVGGYSEWLWTATDYLLYAKLIAAGWRFRYVNRRLAHYQWPLEASKSNQPRRIERAHLAMWLSFAARHPLTPGPRRQVRSRLKHELEIKTGRVPSSAS